MALPSGPHCPGCVLATLGEGFQRGPDGPPLPPTGVLLVGEALGGEEAIAGRPFVGPAGQLLDRLLSRTIDPSTGEGFKREDFLIDNVLRCRPPGNVLAGASYEAPAIQHCKPYLTSTLAASRPRVVLAMGATAGGWFIPQMRGAEVKDWRGYVEAIEDRLVVPTYHPAFLLRGNMALAQAFQFDLLRAVHISRNGLSRKPVQYYERPTLADVATFVATYEMAGPEALLAFDIETLYSADFDEAERSAFSSNIEEDPSYTIIRISFSFEEQRAITFPWQPPFIEAARALLSDPRAKLAWNADFDVPRLRAAGIKVAGTIYDEMWLWHYLEPHLPYGLGYASTFCTDLAQWKHLASTRPEFYSCVDADATIRCANYIHRELRSQGKWALVERDIIQVSQVLRRISEHGVLTDPALRAKARDDFLRRYREALVKLNSLVPLDIRQSKTYKSRATQPEVVEARLAKNAEKAKKIHVPGDWVQEDDGVPEGPQKEKPKRVRSKRVPKDPGAGSSGSAPAGGVPEGLPSPGDPPRQARLF